MYIIRLGVCRIGDLSVDKVEVWLMKAAADWWMALELRYMTSACSPAEGV